jgi:hypothetical protein
MDHVVDLQQTLVAQCSAFGGKRIESLVALATELLRWFEFKV